MDRTEKQTLVSELNEKFNRACCAVVTEYRGMTVEEISNLRSELRKVSVDYKISKNTLAKLAAKGTGVEGLSTYLEGPTALALGYSDPVAVAKVLTEFVKKQKKGREKLAIKGGVLDGKVLSAADIKALAELPPKEVLLAQLLSVMQSPLSGIVGVMQGNLRNLVYALEGIRKQKAGEN